MKLLANGWTIVTYSRSIVLAMRSTTEYATWYIGPDGHTSWGEYSDTFEGAVISYKRRTGLNAGAAAHEPALYGAAE